jgi:hypothetical protein
MSASSQTSRKGAKAGVAVTNKQRLAASVTVIPTRRQISATIAPRRQSGMNTFGGAKKP